MKKRCVLCVFVLAYASSMLAHPRHTDPILAELNDYLVALQLLRFDNSQAEELFQLWQRVREESWKIRKLTDEQDLPVGAPAVVHQIRKTHDFRSELLERCRQFLSSQKDSMPTVHFHLGDMISVIWSDPVIETPVWSRTVVLIEVENEREIHAHVELFSMPNDQILFWKKAMMVEPRSSRYTFAYFAPSKEGSATTTIFLQEGHDQDAKVRIRANGTPPSPFSSYFLLPGEDPGTVKLPKDGGSPHDHLADVLSTDESIRFRIRDPETSKPLPVRIEAYDEKGKSYWTPLHGPAYAVAREKVGWETPLWQFQTGPYFYIDGDAELGVDPAGKTVRIYHGFEYEPVVMSVPENGLVEVAPRRWIDMAARGWYSGHTHIHTTDVGMPVLFSQFWPLVAQAEDIGISNILTLAGEWKRFLVYADEYPMGVVSWASQEDHIIAYGQEYRNNPYGHLCLLGIDELIQPISSGALGELGGPDYPPNAFILDAALAQNAATVGAHFGMSLLDNEQINTSWSGPGYEMPVDVALKKMQIAEIYGDGGQRDVWYKLLNCGFEIPATAGPDWEMKDTPRTYVYLGDTPLTLNHWIDGLKQGKSFITKGPMISFTVDGERPGARLYYSERPQQVVLAASALLPRQSLPAEIIVNGKVVAKGKDLRKVITLEDSGWIAARCDGAHTSPIYVTLEGRPRGFAHEAEEFIRVIDRLIKWVNTRGLFDTPSQKETVLNIIQQGRAVYESIAERAWKLGRTTGNYDTKG